MALLAATAKAEAAEEKAAAAEGKVAAEEENAMLRMRQLGDAQVGVHLSRSHLISPDLA